MNGALHSQAAPRPRIALAAGEPSGDLLGGYLLAGLMERLKSAGGAAVPAYGIGGPRMQTQGLESLWPMSTLTVNGYVEVLRNLRAILRIRRELIARLRADKPLAFIGIDAPDFNLAVELQLREAGVPVVHFVSPSIWAWRFERIHKIKRAVDHVLCLFPFEPEIYAREGIPATFVGHPLAASIPPQPDVAGARAALGLPAQGRLLAVLPGSRESEVNHLGPTLFGAMQELQRTDADLRFAIPAATPALRARLQQLADAHPGLPLHLIDGNSHRVLEASDIVLLASGTASLEAALYKKPMVITYKVPWLTAQIMKRKGYLPYVGLPNILAGRFIVPELLQDAATPQSLAGAVRGIFADAPRQAEMRAEFERIHAALRRDTGELAAGVVLELLKSRGRLY